MYAGRSLGRMAKVAGRSLDICSTCGTKPRTQCGTCGTKPRSCIMNLMVELDVPHPHRPLDDLRAQGGEVVDAAPLARVAPAAVPVVAIAITTIMPP